MKIVRFYHTHEIGYRIYPVIWRTSFKEMTWIYAGIPVDQVVHFFRGYQFGGAFSWRS